ncbi:MAG TPA: chemotaxis protein CheA [Vicinamibacteria bacterium]|nr:chemotaxis protein CheA [Vicinamibacteria bacterium]
MSDDVYLTPEELLALKTTFYVQTREMLEEFSQRGLALEGSSDSSEILRALERTVHTIKGDSMALGFEALAKLAHRLEDFFRALRDRPILERGAIDLVLACGDTMSELLEAYCAVPRKSIPSIESLCERLAPSVEPSTREMAMDPLPQGRRYRLTVRFAKDCQMRSAGAFLVCQRLSKLGRIRSTNPDPESSEIETAPQWVVELEAANGKDEIRRAARVPGVTSRVVLREQKLPPRTAVEPATDPGEEGSFVQTAGSSTSAASDQLRVEVSKIDRIMNLVGELVIGRSMVTQALSEFSSGATPGTAADRLSDANGFLERTMTELQAAVLKIRMVPVEHVFRRFPRLVRDLALSRGKKVDLDIQGGLTELDKSIVDALGEPLLHLVRNAIDHGLENPRERELAGKPAAGKLKLAAFYEGNHAHVVVEDDGRGIDLARVGERAVALGLIEASQLDAMTPSDILNTIYQPGFSTRETVSDVSGRGIGMDVVRESIENLKGVIELSTAPGQGTRFLIRLPLTLAILRAVLVEVAGKAFAIPLTGVLEIVRLPRDRATTILGHGVLHWRDQVVPLISLREALGFPAEAMGALEESPSTARARDFVLLVGEAERRIGLMAEGLLGEQELVVKPIEDTLARSPGVAGASILGDGRVVLILHTRGLLDKHVSLSRRVEVLR